MFAWMVVIGRNSGDGRFLLLAFLQSGILLWMPDIYIYINLLCFVGVGGGGNSVTRTMMCMITEQYAALSIWQFTFSALEVEKLRETFLLLLKFLFLYISSGIAFPGDCVCGWLVGWSVVCCVSQSEDWGDEAMGCVFVSGALYKKRSGGGRGGGDC